MEEISTFLRRLAQMLDDDFYKNKKEVIKQLKELLKYFK